MDRSFSEPRKHNSDNFVKIACLPNGVLALVLCSTWGDVRKTCPACLHCGESTWKCIHTVRITLLTLLINFSALYALIVANGIVALQKSNKTTACLPSNQSQIMNCTKKKEIYIRCSPCLVSWVIFMSCGLHLATVILKEFPAICIQLNFLTDLDLLINTEIWRRENLCCQGHFLKTITMGLADCRFRKYAEGKKQKRYILFSGCFEWMKLLALLSATVDGSVQLSSCLGSSVLLVFFPPYWQSANQDTAGNQAVLRSIFPGVFFFFLQCANHTKTWFAILPKERSLAVGFIL